MLEFPVPNDGMTGFAALRAIKTIWPQYFFEFGRSLFLGTVFGNKLAHGEPFLELDFVDGHG